MSYALYLFCTFGRRLGDFWRPLDFEGVSKSHLFNETQHKMKQNEVQEGVLKKYDFSIDF